MEKSCVLEIDGKRLQIQMQLNENEMSIVLHGRTYSVNLDRKANYTIVNHDNKPYRVAVKRINSRIYESETFGEVHRVVLHETSSDSQPATRTEAVPSAPEMQDDSFEVTSPIPGTLVSIEVKPGEEIRHGDCLCVVEAMKLYNEVESPYDGVVREIKAAPGQPVMPGDGLVVLDLIKEQA